MNTPVILNQFIDFLAEKHGFNVSEELTCYSEQHPDSYENIVHGYIKEAAMLTGNTIEDLRGDHGTTDICLIRHILMYTIKHNHPVTLKAVGREFDRGHSTVIRALRRYNELLEFEDKLFMKYHNLLKHLINEPHTEA